MFNTKKKTEMAQEKPTNGNGTTLIGAGTTLKGDISSNSDLRIDGTVIGNIHSSSKVIIGANGVVEGDITGNQADIIGKVTGNIKAKDLLQLRGDSMVTGNLYAEKYNWLTKQNLPKHWYVETCRTFYTIYTSCHQSLTILAYALLSLF